MTKLGEWLTAFSVLLAIYGSLVTRQITNDWSEAWMFEIQIAPIIAVGLFGVSESQNIFFCLFMSLRLEADANIFSYTCRFIR